jgi:chromosome partitioning protein
MDLVGISEVAELAGVTRQAVANWRNRYSDFPRPLADLKSGPVWNRDDIIAWLKQKDGKMTKVISFINLKGGVGKTTSAVAIAEFLADEHMKNVLVVDLDPQTNATVALISEQEWQQRDDAGQTLKQLFKDKLEKTNTFDIQKAIVRGVSNLHNGIARLALLPSSLGLIELQDQLALIPGGNFYAVSPVEVLAGALRPVMDGFDYVLIDCPPNLGIITLNGINMSTGYVIPVVPDILSTYGIPQILNRIETFAVTKGISAQPKGIIVSKYRAQSALHNSKLSQMRSDATTGALPPVFPTVIPEAAKIAESADFEARVNTLRQKYGYGNNYERYSSLAQEFINLC